MIVSVSFRKFRVIVPVALVLIFLSLVGTLGKSLQAAETHEVSFSREIIPLLTRHGCNTGACHGAAAGRGYLRLSLFGSRPKDDFESLVHSGGGRLVNLGEPDESLLLLKPTEQLEHGGGQRLESGGSAYETLRSWIRNHAPSDAFQPVADLEIQQADELTIPVNSTARLSVGAVWGGVQGEKPQIRTDFVTVIGAGEGSDDATDPVTFVRRENYLLLTGHRVGYWPVTVRIGAVAKAVGIWVTPAQVALEHNGATNASTEIDAITGVYATRAGLESAGKCATTLLVRRLWIDLLGRHPSQQEWSDAVRRIEAGEKAELVDDLLNSDDFYRQCSTEISSWVTDAAVGKYARSSGQLVDAIVDQLSASDDMRVLVRLMLRVPDIGVASPLTEFHRFASDPRERTELVADAWMGVQMGCAKCHDHPLDSWTQDDYFSMSACWAPVQIGDRIKRLPRRTTTDLRTELPAVAALPKSTLAGESDVAPGSASGADDHAFVEWLVAEDNPYFDDNITNRVWAWLIGEGLVSPVNDFRSTNPPIAPALLEHLSGVFTHNQNSVRAVVRAIVLSDTYARKSSQENTRLARILGASREPKKISLSAVHLTRQLFDASQATAASDTSGQDAVMMSVDRDSCTRAVACDDPLSDRLRLVTGADLSEEIRDGVIKLSEQKQAADPLRLLNAVYIRIFGVAATKPIQNDWRLLLDEQQSAELVEGEEFQGQEIVEAIVWGWVVSDRFRSLY